MKRFNNAVESYMGLHICIYAVGLNPLSVFKLKTPDIEHLTGCLQLIIPNNWPMPSAGPCTYPMSIPLRMKIFRSGLSMQSVKNRKSTRLNSSHVSNSYAVFCLKKKKKKNRK